MNFKHANLEREKIPFEDNKFDIVYSKSFVEHFYYPEKIYEEILGSEAWWKSDYINSSLEIYV